MTRRAAAMCASALPASLGAAVSTRRPCTATQVCPHLLVIVPLGVALLCVSPVQQLGSTMASPSTALLGP